MNSKDNIKLSIVGFIVIVTLLSFYFFYRSNKEGESLFGQGKIELDGGRINIDDLGSSPTANPGEVLYVNNKYGFSFSHTPESVINEFDEGGGATTIVVEERENVRGMQVFILPYAEEKISEERFKRDVTSGIRENTKKTFIGQPPVEAVTFNSRDTFLGETLEVWFIYKGHLYEITTFATAGDWFTPLMQSWRFQ